MPQPTEFRSPRLILLAGARQVEQRLLAELDSALPVGRIPPRPVRVVVPSHSLREHLAGRLCRERPAWLGLEIQTLAGVAATILERSGSPPESGEVLLPVLVARIAGRERLLAGALGGLTDGYSELVAPVRDLLDAGFAEEHLDAVEERLELEREGVGTADVERAAAIARVAAGVRSELASLGLVPDAERFAEAARRFATDPDLCLPSSALFVHGFADATGVATDLIAALMRPGGAVALVETPPSWQGQPGSWRFGARLIERLSGLAPVERPESAPASTVRLRAWRAGDPTREARAVAAAIADPEAASGRPEAVAVVARDLAGSLPVLAAELDRMGVPCSAGVGLPGPESRRSRALLELLERRGDASIGVTLAALGGTWCARLGVSATDLRHALVALGARTLGTAARCAVPESFVRLRLDDRIEAGDGEGISRRRARKVPAAAVAAAVRTLADLAGRLQRLDRPQTLGQRLEGVRELLESHLEPAAAATLLAPLARFARAPLAALKFDAEESRRLIERAWSDGLEAPLGAGAGVALLSVTEARARTFERIFVPGLVRDRFPRPVRPDPLLPDALRLRLREVLPDLPVKAEGHDEERFLFAQLLGAAEEVVLLRPAVDEDGRPAPASPLLDELVRAGRVEEQEAPSNGPLSPLDRAVAAGLESGFRGLAAALPAVLRVGRELAPDRVERLTRSRLAVLAENGADPARPTSHGLGPYFGRLGTADAEDPRRRPIPVTTLERFAGCGWRVLLERLLGLGPPADPDDALPELPARLAGSVAHRVLEGLVSETSGRRRVALSEVADAAPLDCRWPGAEELERRTRAAARIELADESLDPALFEAPLVLEALDRLAVARELDGPGGPRGLLGVEIEGSAPIAVAERAARDLPFRADRAESCDGQLVLTDFKTGRPLTTAAREDTRRRHLERAIARGDRLQLVAYLLALGDRPGRARYLFLGPATPEAAREIALGSDELDRKLVRAVLSALFGAWEVGAFLPRLLEPDLRQTFSECAWCEVREACLQGDSGARRRLEEWAGRAGEPSPEGHDGAVAAWWRLRAAGGEGGHR